MNVDLLIKENKELSEEKQRYKEMWFFANDSLSKYKDLEEKIGCPLDVRERAFEKGFYDENGNHYTCEHYVPYLKEMHTRGIMTHTQKRFKITDYKKTWWLKRDKSE